ncbi:FxSxx-COOH system tetratricopeptide repeat protein [Streptomyces sp. NPDC093970]|uniref:FxSxx-COOH system tetratricopeptide repeat protein n=1 Tax=Streptomyces sp. NPDC093970 TaxID=3155076 RepID=UPI00343014F5
MTGGRDGRIVTFYSYKGGVGRTMAVANVAWILAANGHRVLAADWDFETPGLHSYFHPFLPPDTVQSTTGLVDLFADFVEFSAEERLHGTTEEEIHQRYARVMPHVVSVDWAFPGRGSLEFLSAGRRNRDYQSMLASFAWDDLDERFLGALREDMRREYDFVLLDSRSGLSDPVEICTRYLPDTLVSCFTLSGQSIDGAAQAARYIARHSRGRDIAVLPVAMRVGEARPDALAAGQHLARLRFPGLPSGLQPDALDRYWTDIRVPYRPFYEYEEILAVFGDPPGEPDSLLAAYERLASAVTGGRVARLPALEEEVRTYHLGAFVRRPSPEATPLVLSYAPRDRMWADWVVWVLGQAGFRVLAPGADPDVEAGSGLPPRTVALLSAAYLRSRPSRTLRHTRSTPVLLRIGDADGELAPGFEGSERADLTGLDADEARIAVLRAVGGQPDTGVPSVTGPRFPGHLPTVWQAPARNPHFAGRDHLLDTTHDLLTVSRRVAVASFATAGLGRHGFAKEYVHRFRADYDIVWWVPAADRYAAVMSLAGLARRMELPDGDGVEAAARRVLAALAAEAGRRWLLVYDDIGDPLELDGLLPSGPGRVLFTTNAPAPRWPEHVDVVSVAFASRLDGVELLRDRVPGLTAGDADAIAARLDDLPLAVEQAALWLTETGTPAADYLDGLEGRTDAPTRAASRAVEAKSPAAYRMLCLLCHLAALPVPLSVINGEAMLTALRPYDAGLRDPLQLGPLVRELTRFGLAEADQPGQVLRVPGLVRRFVRENMSDEETRQANHEVHRVLGTAPDDPALWPHLDHSRADGCPDEPVRMAVVERVRGAVRIGAPEQAVEVALRARARVEAWPRNDRWTLALDHEQAAGLRALGRYRAAYELDVRTLAAQQSVLPAADPHLLMSHSALTEDLRALGRFGDALESARRTYDGYHEVYGAEHVDSLAAAAALAEAMRLTGDHGAARTLHQAVWQAQGDMFGTMHAARLNTALGLARDLREAGAYREAVKLLRSYEGPGGPRVALGLAVCLRRLGRIVEAQKALAAAGSGLADPTGLLGRVVALENALCGEAAAAVEPARLALRAFDAHYGPDHPETLVGVHNLAVCLRASGDAEGAREAAGRAAPGLRRALGEGHPYAVRAESFRHDDRAGTATPSRAADLEFFLL